MVVKDGPNIMPAIDMPTGQAVVYINKLKGLYDELNCLKVGEKIVGSEMGYLVFDKLLNDIGQGDIPRIVDLQKGGTDVPHIVRGQLNDANEFNYGSVIAHVLGSGHNPEPMNDKEIGVLQAYVDQSKENGMTPIVVLELTPSGSTYFLREGASEELAEISYNMGVRHFVAPATRPERIKVYRKIIGDESQIISPGMGKQKTDDPVKDIEAATYAGTDIAVIGRAMIGAKDPVEMAKRLYETMYKAHRDRKGY